MRRRIMALLALILMMFAWANAAWAAESAPGAELSEQVGEVAAELNFGELDAVVAELEDYLQEQYGGFDLKGLWRAAKAGELEFSAGDVWFWLSGLLGKSLPLCGVLLVRLLLLAVLSMFLVNLQQGFGRGTIAVYGQSIVYLVLIAIALQAFELAGSAVSEALLLMSDFLYALLPVMMTMLVAMGGVAAVSVFNPALTVAVGAALSLLRFVVLPLGYGSGALTIAAHIHPELNFGRLAKLLRTVGLSVLSLILAVFIALLGVLGLSGGSISGLSVKAAKSAAGLFIPVVGKSLADLMDTMLGAALVLKSCLGVAGVVIIVLICAVPAVQVLLMAWMFRLSGALCEPLGDKKLADALSELGSVLMMFFGIVAAAGVFFFFLLLIVLAMGNMSMAVR